MNKYQVMRKFPVGSMWEVSIFLASLEDKKIIFEVTGYSVYQNRFIEIETKIFRDGGLTEPMDLNSEYLIGKLKENRLKRML